MRGLGPLARRAIKSLPPIRRLVTQRDELLAKVQELEWITAPADGPPLRFPLGHYFSPFPAIEEIRARESEIFASPAQIAAVDMNEAAQLELIDRLAGYYPEQPFQSAKTEGLRYFFDNGYFQYADGLVLYGMLRHLEPRRIIEVGSGFSSALILDTDQLFLGGGLKATFIDPNPERLQSLLSDADRQRVEVVPRPLHEVELETFDQLEAGDFLFVDSSHVSKAGSDVNTIFFEILPRLKPGVLVHLHDVFHPFEYPADWIYMGRFFTEAYLAHAFLMFNDAFRIRLSNSYLYKFHREHVETSMPLWATAEGASLWIERV